MQHACITYMQNKRYIRLVLHAEILLRENDVENLHLLVILLEFLICDIDDHGFTYESRSVGLSLSPHAPNREKLKYLL